MGRGSKCSRRSSSGGEHLAERFDPLEHVCLELVGRFPLFSEMPRRGLLGNCVRGIKERHKDKEERHKDKEQGAYTFYSTEALTRRSLVKHS
jgi:hypothetical protein